MKKALLCLATVFFGLTSFKANNSEKSASDFHFTENKGQYHQDVKYLCKLHVGEILFKDNSFTFDLFSAKELEEFYKSRHNHGRKGKHQQEHDHDESMLLTRYVYNTKFIGANTNNVLVADDRRPYYKNYFRGNDASKWASNVSAYGELTYRNIYDGIDIHFYTKNDQLKYDYLLAAGANAEDIKVQYEGVSDLVLENGNLVVKLPNEQVKELKPIAYQLINGVTVNVPCKYVVEGNVLTFAFPNGYNQNEELVIDPTYEFSTYTGAGSDNWGFTATYDNTGAFYGGSIVIGDGIAQNNANYPTTGGAYQTNFASYVDVAISKFSSDGTQLLYSTYLGGGEMEEPHSLVCDSANNIVVLGATSSNNFPTTGTAYQGTFGGGNIIVGLDGLDWDNGSDIFITKLNAAGSALLGSTFLGGSANDGLSLDAQLNYNYADHARGEVVIDGNDNIYIASSTNSSNFPTSPTSHSQALAGGYDAVVAKFNADLSSLLWGTYLGGANGDAGYSVRYDRHNDKVFICGGTENNGLATGGVLNTSLAGGVDGYIAKFDNSNGTLDAYTYLGTGAYDQAYILELDFDEEVYVTGQTRGAYPVTGGVYSNNNGSQFIHKLDNDLTTTDYSTVFGEGSGTGVDISITAFLVDNCKNVYVAGWGGATNNEGNTNGMPITGDAYQSTTDGSDFYFIVLERDAQSLLYGTYFGSGSTEEHVDGGTARFDPQGTIYQGVCAGCGGSSSFPTSPGAYSSTNGSSNCNYGAIKISLDFQGVTAQADDPGDVFICNPPFDVDFSAGATPPPHVYWDFGDGTTNGIGTDYTPTHTYADSGSYNVMYVAIDSSSCNISDTAYFDVNIIKTGDLDAQINIPPYNDCQDSLTINLEFTGTGADSIYWDMGDGTTYINDTLVNHTYTTNGDFIVVFEAYEFTCNGFETLSDTIHFNPNYTAVQAQDPGDQQFCTQPYEVAFDDTTGVASPPNNYWDFGDGTTLTDTNYILYNYADTGSYTVMYVAIDSSTCNVTDTAYFDITLIQPEELDAQFTIPPYNDCQDSLTINLEFTGTGADSLYWNLGDGTTYINDTLVNHTYTNNGDFIVTFEAYDFDCNNSEIFTDTIHFNPNYTAVQAQNPGDQEFCAQPFEVNFTDANNPPPNNYWDFGDGNSVMDSNTIMYTYADTGSYTVMYVAIDSSTCNVADTAYFDITLIQPEELDAQFTIPPYNDCQDSLTINLEFTGTGADSLYWNLGDGTTYINDTLINHTYTANGDFVVTFEAYDFDCNNAEIFTDTIRFNPSYTAVQAQNPGDQTLCAQPYNVDFSAGATPPPNNYWDFGDGSGSSVLADVTYTYADTGSYTVMYVAIDSSTCNIADTAYFDITLIQPEELDAQFTIPPYDPCQDSLAVSLQFTGTGADSIYWDMGNGVTFVNNTNVDYTYTTPGEFEIEMIAFDFDCNVSQTITDTVWFNPNMTQVNTTVQPDQTICGNDLDVQFSSGSPAPPNNYWDFGDGTNSTSIDPLHLYPDTGSYNIMFVAIDSSTCNIADTAYFSLDLNQVPDLDVNIDYTPPVPCEAVTYEVSIKATAEGADSIYWDMGDGMEFINDTMVTYEYAQPGTYNITITLFNECGPQVFSESATFIELGESSGIIPNVFTPNGDGMNDELEFLGVDMTQDYSIKIFNRWGRMMYESTNPDENWDGLNAEDGTYFYELRYTDVCSSEEMLVTGTVSLLGRNQ